MNWKLLPLSVLGLTLLACDAKKEEKKAEEAAPHAATLQETKPAEAPKASHVTPAEEPKKEEYKTEEHKTEEHKKEEHKAS